MSDGNDGGSRPRSAAPAADPGPAGHDPDGTCYRVEGRGRPVVLIHGVGLDHRMWDAQAAALADRFRVVRYDMLGHGRSAPSPAGEDMTGYVSQLVRLLDHLDTGPMALVGFSMGAMVAQDFARACPERVARLALMNAVFRRSRAQREAVRARVALVAEQGLEAIVEAALERWFTPAYRASREDVVASVRGCLLGNDRATYLAAYRLFAEADAALGDGLETIACPTLVLTGADDVGSTPEMARAMAGILADARLVVLPGARHMAPVEAAPAVSAALREFLRSWEGSAPGDP